MSRSARISMCISQGNSSLLDALVEDASRLKSLARHAIYFVFGLHLCYAPCTE